MFGSSGIDPGGFDPTVEDDDEGLEVRFLADLATVYRPAYACALSVVGNRDDADDIMQEACIVLWQKYPEYEQGTDFRRWACSVTFHVAKAYARKHRKYSFGFSDLALEKIQQVRTGGAELFDLRREVLRDCMLKLPERERTFLAECYGSPLSQVGFARSKGLSVETIYTRLKRIRKKLIDCIGRTLGDGV